VKLHLRGGHSLDGEGLEGTASLTGGLLDQGTAKHTEEQIAALLEPEGGSIHGDATGLSGAVASGAWTLLVRLACELVREPRFPADKVARQKQRLLDRLLIELDDHRVQTAQRFRRLVYGDHWLGRSVHGSIESVERIERKHLVAHHKKNWCPTRTVIAVCGDVDPTEVQKQFDRHLAGWKRKKPLGPPVQDFPELAPRSDSFYADRQQVHVFVGHLGVRRADPQYPALVLMDHVLGTGPGFSNRISRRLRDEEGLAYSVYSDIHSSAGLFPGMFTAYIGTSPEHLERAVAGLVEEMRRIRDEPVERDELELARSYLLGSYALGFERASRRVGYMISAERFQLPPNHLEALAQRFSTVTLDEVAAAARSCLHPSASCLAVGGPVERTRVEAVLADIVGSRPRRARRRSR
jgi:zinc protease